MTASDDADRDESRSPLPGFLAPGSRLRRVAGAFGLVVFLAVVGLFVATAVPGLVGADHSYVVRSDSMSPAIDAGSVVFVSEVPADRIDDGDIITFEGNVAGPVTHRVVDVDESGGEPHFRTKGDANDDADPGLVAPSQVVGKVSVSVPLVGYVLAFGGTGAGLLVLVVVPAVVLVALEVRDLLADAETETDVESPTGVGDDDD